MIRIKGKLKIKDRASWKAFYEQATNLPESEYRYFLCDEKPNRTLRQNAYYHGVVVKVLSGHIGYHPEEVHEYLKRRFNGGIIPDPETGEELEIGKTTTKLNTAEFSTYVDKIRQWAMDSLGCYIPAANEVPDELIILNR